MKKLSAFPKATVLLKPTIRLFSVISRTVVEGVLLLCRNAVGVFYSPSRLGGGFTEDPYRPQAQPSSSLAYFTRPYILGN